MKFENTIPLFWAVCTNVYLQQATLRAINRYLANTTSILGMLGRKMHTEQALKNAKHSETLA